MRSSNEQCWERTHSWGDKAPDLDWDEEIEANGWETKPVVSAKVNKSEQKELSHED